MKRSGGTPRKALTSSIVRWAGVLTLFIGRGVPLWVGGGTIWMPACSTLAA
jgi:hypothetical protein